jgi:hypothetical protein
MTLIWKLSPRPDEASQWPGCQAEYRHKEYHRWSKKADGYVAVMTVVALHSSCWGTRSTARLRLFFAISALVILHLPPQTEGLIMIA